MCGQFCCDAQRCFSLKEPDHAVAAHLFAPPAASPNKFLAADDKTPSTPAATVPRLPRLTAVGKSLGARSIAFFPVKSLFDRSHVLPCSAPRLAGTSNAVRSKLKQRDLITPISGGALALHPSRSTFADNWEYHRWP
jgi:hypothetical protein